jgi:hypothetical protein
MGPLSLFLLFHVRANIQGGLRDAGRGLEHLAERLRKGGAGERIERIQRQGGVGLATGLVREAI